MSHILLIRPPAVFAKNSYSAPVSMPLSIAYLAAALREAGHEVSVIDALGEGLENIAQSYSPSVQYRGLPTEKIIERISKRPDGIGVTAMFSQDWPHIEGIINAIHGKFPDVPIILGGEHATAAGEYVLRSCPAVTHAALGEGEETIVDFAEYLGGKKRLEEVGGVQYIDSGGRLTMNAPRERIRGVDSIPWPAWELFNLEKYFATGEGHGVERGRSMPIMATRGCPYQCTFCSSPLMWTTRYVMRSVSDVVDEIEEYQARYKAQNIDFYDLTAIVKKDWIMQFCGEVRRRKLKFTWQLPSGTRSEAIDAEVLSNMAAAGCMNMTYAPESGSVKTLKDIKKRVVLPRLIDSIAAAVKNGIFVKCNLIIGFPKETRRDIFKTLWLAIKFAWLGVDDTGLYVFSPYPGSELYQYLLTTGAISRMDRGYFESLMSFMNIKSEHTYCENIGARELAWYRVIGMSLFYGLSYLLHPSRALRTLRNYRAHVSDTVFEERLFGLIKRRRLAKKTVRDRSSEKVVLP